MKMKWVYLVFCWIGIALPSSQFVWFLLEPGSTPQLFVEQLFANRISSFFALDVVVSSVVLWVWAIAEGRRLKIRWFWLPIVANLLVGVSLALPLFLYLREEQREKEQQPEDTDNSVQV